MDYVHFRKKLLFVAQHRAIKEMDIVYGRFLTRYFDGIADEDLVVFEDLMWVVDDAMYRYISDKETPPKTVSENKFFPLLKQCLSYS